MNVSPTVLLVAAAGVFLLYVISQRKKPGKGEDVGDLAGLATELAKRGFEFITPAILDLANGRYDEARRRLTELFKSSGNSLDLDGEAEKVVHASLQKLIENPDRKRRLINRLTALQAAAEAQAKVEAKTDEATRTVNGGGTRNSGGGPGSAA